MEFKESIFSKMKLNNILLSLETKKTHRNIKQKYHNVEANTGEQHTARYQLLQLNKENKRLPGKWQLIIVVKNQNYDQSILCALDQQVK